MEKWRESERDGERDERERDVVLCLLTFVYCLFHLLWQYKHISHANKSPLNKRERDDVTGWEREPFEFPC